MRMLYFYDLIFILQFSVAMHQENVYLSENGIQTKSIKSTSVIFTVKEESSIPQIIGNIMQHLEMVEAQNTGISNIMFFPSNQAYSEYFQLPRKLLVSDAGNAQTSCNLKLQKSIDLEEVCRTRLFSNRCNGNSEHLEYAQKQYTCCCNSNFLFCSIYLQMAAVFVSAESETPFPSAASWQSPFSVFLVEVRVEDLNDNDPIFAQPYFTLRIREGLQSASLFQLPVARDSDLGANAELTYSLVDIKGKKVDSDEWHYCPFCSGIFELNHTRIGIEGPTSSDLLHLLVHGNLDREEINEYELEITATDNGRTTRRTGTLTVKIEVADMNDMHPVFKETQVQLKVDENVPVGTFLARLIATDDDFGSNGKVAYFIKPSNTVQDQHELLPFRLDSETGILVVSQVLDHEKKSDYQFTIEAVDHGNPPKRSDLKVSVKVQDVNDNAPLITIAAKPGFEAGLLPINKSLEGRETWRMEFELLISEATSVGSHIADIFASDADEGSNGTVNCLLQNDNFQLEEDISSGNTNKSKHYRLYLNGPFDHELSSYLRLVLACMDSGIPFQRSQHAYINIHVGDANDHFPVISQSTVLPPAWQINASFISSLASAHTSWKASVEAIVNSRILFIFLPKSVKPGQTFLKFTVSDGDSNENGRITFELFTYEQRTSGEIDDFSGLFAIDNTTGGVYLKSSADYLKSHCILQTKLVVRDSGTPPLTASMEFAILLTEENTHSPTLKILNFGLVSSNSPFQSFNTSGKNITDLLIPFYIPKQTQGSTVIGQIIGFDNDAGLSGQVSFQMTFQRNSRATGFSCLPRLHEQISLNNVSGIISLISNATTDSHLRCRVEATVHAMDDGFPQRSSIVRIFFQEFDAIALLPRIVLDKQFLAGDENDTNIHLCSQATCTPANFYFHLPLVHEIGRSDEGYKPALDFPLSLFQLQSQRIDGLLEPEFKLDDCQLPETVKQTVTGLGNSLMESAPGYTLSAFLMNRDDGKLFLIRPLEQNELLSNETLYITVGNRMWSSIPRLILRLNLYSKIVSMHTDLDLLTSSLSPGSFLRLSFDLQLVAKSDCKLSGENASRALAEKESLVNFKTYIFSIWAVICLLCLLLLLEAVVLKKLRAHLYCCRRWYKNASQLDGETSQFSNHLCFNETRPGRTGIAADMVIANAATIGHGPGSPFEVYHSFKLMESPYRSPNDLSTFQEYREGISFTPPSNLRSRIRPDKMQTEPALEIQTLQRKLETYDPADGVFGKGEFVLIGANCHVTGQDPEVENVVFYRNAKPQRPETKAREVPVSIIVHNDLTMETKRSRTPNHIYSTIVNSESRADPSRVSTLPRSKKRAVTVKESTQFGDIKQSSDTPIPSQHG